MDFKKYYMARIENQKKCGLTKEANFTIVLCSFKKWLRDNDIEMYSIHIEEKSVVAERFIRTLKTKIYDCMFLLCHVRVSVWIHTP